MTRLLCRIRGHRWQAASFPVATGDWLNGRVCTRCKHAEMEG